MVTLIFGDSITQGAWDTEGGWVSRLINVTNKKIIESDFDYYNLIFNLGISGDKTSELLVRLEGEIKARQDPEMTLVFAIGINDSQYQSDEKAFRTSPEDFRKNLKEIIQIASKYSKRIVFIGLTPVDESKVDPTPWTPGKSYKNEYIEKYDDIVKEIATENGADFIDVLGVFKKEDYKSLLIDGLHPNTRGHELMFEVIKNKLT